MIVTDHAMLGGMRLYGIRLPCGRTLTVIAGTRHAPVALVDAFLELAALRARRVVPARVCS